MTDAIAVGSNAKCDSMWGATKHGRHVASAMMQVSATACVRSLVGSKSKHTEACCSWWC